MKEITIFGKTVPQSAFGALPMQRISKDAAVALVRKAYDGGMRFSIPPVPILTAKKSWGLLWAMIGRIKFHYQNTDN